MLEPRDFPAPPPTDDQLAAYEAAALDAAERLRESHGVRRAYFAELLVSLMNVVEPFADFDEALRFTTAVAIRYPTREAFAAGGDDDGLG